MLPPIQVLQENKIIFDSLLLCICTDFIEHRDDINTLSGIIYIPLIQILSFLEEADELRSSMEIQIRRTERQTECKCKALAQ